MTALEAALDEARSHARSKEQKLTVTAKELKASREAFLAIALVFTSHCAHLWQADRIHDSPNAWSCACFKFAREA